MIRPMCAAKRLDVAVSGEIGQWEHVSNLSGVITGLGAGKIIDGAKDLNIGIKIHDWIRPVSDSIGAKPDPLVKTTRYVDPLILDLDGNGLIITPIRNGVLFDANGDSIKTGTAWAKDGIVVLDINNNGVIDSGRELFGNETFLKDGTKAVDGFSALADLDDGSLIDDCRKQAGNLPRCHKSMQ